MSWWVFVGWLSGWIYRQASGWFGRWMYNWIGWAAIQGHKLHIWELGDSNQSSGWPGDPGAERRQHKSVSFTEKAIP